jgi:Ca2+-binding RTX toxin-like protein
MATEPTAQDQYMLELLNRARSTPQSEANSLLGGNLNEGPPSENISTAPKQPLAFNLQLFQGAQGHSQWMLANGVFEHTQTNGSTPQNRANSAGYSGSVGENIAWQGTTGTPNWTSIVGQQHNDLFIDAGIAGRGHRVNMMDPRFREIGISSVVGSFQGFNAVMTTQNFGFDNNPNPFLTGVVYTDKVTDDNFYTVGEGLGGITITAIGNGQTFTGKSMSAGGYSLRLAAGSYDVSFSGDFNGDGITDTTAARTVTLGSENVKLDFASDTYTPSAVTNPPVVTQPPVVTEPPAVTNPPVVTQPPVVAQPPAVTNPPVITQPPVVTEPPAVTNPPVVAEPPAVTNPPVVTEPPVAGNLPTAQPNKYMDVDGSDSMVLKVEDLKPTVKAARHGNGHRNKSVNNSTANTLYEGEGNYFLTGGLGANRFHDRWKNGSINTVSDFDSASGDKITLAAKDFGDCLVAGIALEDSQLLVTTSGSNATTSSQCLIYDSSTGGLFFDADGSGNKFGAVQFASLNNKPNLSAADFAIV